MPAKKSSSRHLANCLRALADALEQKTFEEVLDEIEAALAYARGRLIERQAPDRVEATATSSLSSEEATSQVQLSIMEFGRNIMSEVEFPSKKSLLEFALKRGVQVSERDTKDTIRRKLISKAELRNLDTLIRRESKS